MYSAHGGLRRDSRRSGDPPQRHPGESAFEDRHRMEAMVSQIALALERVLLAERARKAQMEAESERSVARCSAACPTTSGRP